MAQKKIICTSTVDALCEFIGSKEKMPNYTHDPRLTIIK